MAQKTYKKKQKYLFVDTCNFIQCCFLEIEGDDINVLMTLHKLLNEDKVKLLLPEIIKIEFIKIFNSKKEDLFCEINKHKKEIMMNGRLNKKPKDDIKKIIDLYMKKKETTAEKVKLEIESIFKHKNTIQSGLELTPNIFVEAYKVYLKDEKPYRNNKKKDDSKQDKIIQNDCLIIETLKSFLNLQSNYTFYFCSQNKIDFGDFNKKNKKFYIHQDIKEKFKNIDYFENLGKLLNSKFKTKLSPSIISRLEKEIILNEREEMGTTPDVLEKMFSEVDSSTN